MQKTFHKGCGRNNVQEGRTESQVICCATWNTLLLASEPLWDIDQFVLEERNTALNMAKEGGLAAACERGLPIADSKRMLAVIFASASHSGRESMTERAHRFLPSP